VLENILQVKLNILKKNNGIGKLQRKSELCTNMHCKYINNIIDCEYAHGQKDLFCTKCYSKGHCYKNCDKDENRLFDYASNAIY